MTGRSLVSTRSKEIPHEGKRIIDAAKGKLKKVTLELGGRLPNVVFADADMEVAIPGGANAIFFHHGQCCAAGLRLFIE